MYKPGFIALLTVLVISAVALLVGTGLVIRAIGATNITLATDAMDRTYVAATACAEHALISLKSSLSYAGNESMTLSNGDTCRILAVTGVGNLNRVIQTTSTVQGATRKMQVNVGNVNPTMGISSWQDVAAF